MTTYYYSSLYPPSPVYSLPSASSSPSISDCEIYPMNEQSRVKNLLNLFPPPITAEEYVLSNSFSGPDGHVKRPSNCFMIFRKIAHDQKSQTPDLTHYNEREFSKIIASIWRDLSKVELSTYRELSKEIGVIHKREFPEYKYKPKRDKAAWKHYNPPVEDKNVDKRSKNKRNLKLKNSVREQKQQEPNNNNYPRTPEPEIIPEISLDTQHQTMLSDAIEYGFSQNPITPIELTVTPTELTIPQNDLDISPISPDDLFLYYWTNQF